MKKTLALALAVMMFCLCALTVSAAETNLPDVTFGGWWTAHSQGVQITEEGFTMTFTADTEDGAALNYCVPTVVIHAGSADAVGAEYWCQRADAWGWLYAENVGDNADALHAKGYSWNFIFEESFGSWENFQATTEAGTQATITAKLEGTNVLLTYKIAGIINEVTIPVDAANPVYLCITGERCAISNIVVTTPDPEPVEDTTLKVSVWTKNGDWVTADELAAIQTGFEAYLADKGYDLSKLTLTYEETVTEGNKVADLGAAVNAAGDFDIIIGCGKNVSTTGGVEAIEKAVMLMSHVAQERYVAKLTENTLAAELYIYLTTVEPIPEEPVAESKTLSIGDKVITAEGGKWLYNTEVTKETTAGYTMIVFDKNYAGTFETNGYGVALVLDQYGTLVRVYDGANVGFWTAEGKAASAHFNANTYATTAWAELQDGETLIIIPNDGGSNDARKIALSMRGDCGKTAALEGFTFETAPEEPTPTEPQPTEPAPTEPQPTEPSNPENPDTGDIFGIVVALMAVSGMALVVLKKRN